MKLRDLTGQKFERLTVVKRAPNDGRRTHWYCRCDCGIIKSVRSESLLAGLISSCGCLAIDRLRSRSIKHGHALNYKASKELNAWCGAKSRCYNPKDEKYHCYGARGITMCNEWRNDAKAFLDYMGPCPPKFTLDRIDVNGNYEPGNCRWASHTTQARNRQNSIWVRYGDENINLKSLAEKLNVDYKRLHFYYRTRKIPLNEAINKLTGNLNGI